jgi:hypothetical protein
MFAKVRDAIRDAFDDPADEMPADWKPTPYSGVDLERLVSIDGMRLDDPEVTIHIHKVRGVVVSFAVETWVGESAAPPAPAAANRVLPFPPHLVMPAKPIITGLSGWRGTYAAYTSHPEFRRIAALAKKEWGFTCLFNVNHRGPVEMHHRTYAHVPFGENWRDLIPLCAECHGRHHLRLAKPPRGLFDDDAIQRAA